MFELTSNQYYLLIAGKEPIVWDIHQNNPNPELLWTVYYNKILQIFEQKSQIKGLVVYITRDVLDRLPSYGENVVVLIAADEWYRIPKYAHKVLAVFKSYGTKPFIGCNPLLQPSYQNLTSLVQYLRIWLACLPGLFNYWWQIVRSFLFGKLKIPQIYTIPLGYYNLLELPIKDLKNRNYDVFFAGSVFNDPYSKNFFKAKLALLLRPPKTQARQKMLFNVEKFKREHPEFEVELALTTGFFTMTQEHLQTYSERLMNAKICLIPRGTSYETYRFFEAIKYGCIPIVEALPSRWFYDNSPAIEVNNWYKLDGILKQLLTTPYLLEKKHQQSLLWWKEKCSEDAVSNYMIEKLKALSC